MIEKEHIKEYNKNGVVVIKSILDRSLLEDIKLEVQNIFVKAFLKNNISSFQEGKIKLNPF